MINTNLKELNYAFENTSIVIIIMSASWCGPCKIVHPILEEISEEYKEITMFDCDVDENHELSQQYNVRNIPTVLFFKNKKLIDKQIGAVSKAEYIAKINSLK